MSLLLADTGSATASYGYRAYGDADDELTAGDFDPSDRTESAGLLDNPLNAYRYSAKRFDSGSGSIDMGARRFGPDTARFLQRDNYNGATADLGLALDPLTQNRYALASGNPISYMEWDGHVALADGGGGGATSPAPSGDDTGGKIVTGLKGIAEDNTTGLAANLIESATHLDETDDNLALVGIALTHLDITAVVANQNFTSGVDAFGKLPLDEQIRFVGNAIVGGFGPKAGAAVIRRIPGRPPGSRIQDVARAQAAQGTAHLSTYLSAAERAAATGAGGSRFFGQAAHRATAEALEAGYPCRVSPTARADLISSIRLPIDMSNLRRPANLQGIRCDTALCGEDVLSTTSRTNFRSRGNR